MKAASIAAPAAQWLQTLQLVHSSHWDGMQPPASCPASAGIAVIHGVSAEAAKGVALA